MRLLTYVLMRLLMRLPMRLLIICVSTHVSCLCETSYLGSFSIRYQGDLRINTQVSTLSEAPVSLSFAI